MGGLPGGAGAPVMDGVTLVSVAHARGTSRPAARAAIRAALCASVAGALRLDDVRVDAAPGSAPRLMVGGLASAMGIAISHTGSLSVAGWHAGARIGLDVMEVSEVPDWRAVARDYLGPQVLASLDGTPAQARALAFARAWTAREASLKCLGRGLSEWEKLPAPVLLAELKLAPGFAGALARQG